VDTHCHLDVVDRELGESPAPELALAMAREAGVTRIVQVGCDVASSAWAVETARVTPEVVAAVALHPNDVPRIVAREGREGLDRALARIEDLAGDPVVRAVGETGLDYYRTPDAADQALQHESFRRHIDMAKRLDRTLVIHDREAHADILSILHTNLKVARDPSSIRLMAGLLDLCHLAGSKLDGGQNGNPRHGITGIPTALAVLTSSNAPRLFSQPSSAQTMSHINMAARS
jgi:Tat protein secretion system quality control protein TatD with DNase activity